MRKCARSICALFVGIFSLLGALVASGCRDHPAPNRREVAADEDCVLCHEPEYLATTAPPHEGIFNTECQDCHTLDAWIPAVAIEHEWFVLQNRHAELECTECHTVGFAEGDTPNQCVGCHQADYDMAMEPPHAGYPTDCASCHTDAGWVPSSWQHSFPIEGAHQLITCAACHGDPPTYEGTPTECVGCHRDDYDNSPYMGHQTFPLTCLDCHTQNAWVPALEGAHPNDRFRIDDGAHSGYECTDCHNPELGASTMGANCDCVGCHEGEHTRARMDDKHREVADYPAGAAPPSFCLDCHPDGRN